MSNKKLFGLSGLALILAILLAACGGGAATVEQAVEEAQQQVEEAAPTVQAAVEEVAPTVEAAAEAVEEAAAEPTEAPAEEPTEAPAEEPTEAPAEEPMAEVDYDTAIYGNIDELDLNGVEVTFWHRYEDDSSRGGTINQIIDEFNATNPYGITVVGSFEGNYGDIYDKMIAGLTTGEVPDLVIAYQNQAAAYQVADGLVSLDPYINHPEYGLTEEERADFFPAFLEADKLPQFGGEAFGFPPARSMEVLFYNADWLQELSDSGAISFAGPPETPEQWAEALCAAVDNPFSKNESGTSAGMALDTDASQFAAEVFARGGDIYDYENGEFIYNSPEAIDAMTFLQGLAADGCILQVAEKYGDQTDFANGKILFFVGSSSGLPFVKSGVEGGEVGGFNWSVAAIPHTTPDPVQNIYGASISIPKTTPEKQLAAWLFLKHWTSPEMQKLWAEASNYFPARQSVAEGMSDYFAENEAYRTAFELLPYGKTEAPVAGYDNVRDAVEEAFIDIVFNGADIQSTLDELTDLANEIQAESAP